VHLVVIRHKVKKVKLVWEKNYVFFGQFILWIIASSSCDWWSFIQFGRIELFLNRAIRKKKRTWCDISFGRGGEEEEQRKRRRRVNNIIEKKRHIQIEREREIVRVIWEHKGLLLQQRWWCLQEMSIIEEDIARLRATILIITAVVSLIMDHLILFRKRRREQLSNRRWFLEQAGQSCQRFRRKQQQLLRIGRT